jgi:hypothetical protein
MLFFLHKLLIILATLAMMTGVSTAVFFRRNRHWLKIHKYFNSLGGILLAAGVLMAAAMIAEQQGEHFQGYHPFAGGITFILAALSISLGFYQFRAGARMPQVRILHRWAGRLTLLSLVITIILGLRHAGII